ncbi:MAG TPA: EamA family transporter [Candidatus Nanoarchaeia archaeon]|nr:EamA family transporter [Candidatus Nanoarchaeia archaeon]
MNLLILFLTLVVSFIGAFGAIYLKKAAPSFKLNLKGILFNKYLIIGIIFYALSVLIFIYLLKFAEVSVLYPAIATVYIWVSLFSTKMLDEKMSSKKWMGVLLIILGVIFIV